MFEPIKQRFTTLTHANTEASGWLETPTIMGAFVNASSDTFLSIAHRQRQTDVSQIRLDTFFDETHLNGKINKC